MTNFSSASVRASIASEGWLLCAQLANISVLDYFYSLKLAFLNGKCGARHDRKSMWCRERGKLNYVELTIMKNWGN